MSERRRLLASVATVLTGVDLVQKVGAPVYGHPRGPAFALFAAFLVAAVVWLVPRVPSRPLCACGGVAAAGALGNLLSALLWRGGIPNPIVLGDVAFNIADVCAVAGSAALVVGALLFALRNPALLRKPI